MARLSFYFLFLLYVFSGPSLSKNYQLSQDTNVKFNYFVAGLTLEGEFRVVESKFDINFQYPFKSIFSFKFISIKGYFLNSRDESFFNIFSKFTNLAFESLGKLIPS